jgi:hypothetical protein
MAYAGDAMAHGNARAGLNNAVFVGGNAAGQLAQLQQGLNQPSKGNPMTTARRLVQVCIVDPNENVPLDKCLLFKGDKKLTDATDQELFFEIDIKDILEKHNSERIKIIDKKVKDRTEYLEPAKIRDLKMVVVNIASF